MTKNGMPRKEIEDERAEAGVGIGLRRTHLVALVFFMLAGLLNGESLLRKAELMQYGKGRDLCVAFAKPLAYLSRTTGLAWPRRMLEAAQKNL